MKKTTPNFAATFKALQLAYPTHPFLEVNGDDPYRILISCILSLRTQDSVSLPATQRLFDVAHDIHGILALNEAQLAKLIFPVGFYRTKAANILLLSRRLIQENGGSVPSTLEGLLALKGVGRKTANLVLSLGFHKPAICVDTHVHRISNRLGWVKSKNPAATEQQLMELLPLRYWIVINSVMVQLGQKTCRPQRPRCLGCVIRSHCATGRSTL